MATYKILYWQEVPSQVKADDGVDEITLPMPPRFMEQIDILAAKRKLQSTDDYLAQWKWSEDQDRDGSAEEVASAVVAELDSQLDWSDAS
jgi:Virulence factor